MGPPRHVLYASTRRCEGKIPRALFERSRAAPCTRGSCKILQRGAARREFADFCGRHAACSSDRSKARFAMRFLECLVLGAGALAVGCGADADTPFGPIPGDLCAVQHEEGGI